VTIGASGMLEFSGQMAISAGDNTVGAGNGAVTIAAGGTVTCLGPTVAAPLIAQGLAALVIGEGDYGSGAAGTLDVIGSGALANFGGYGVEVGGAVASDLQAGGGTGFLTISGGGTLLCGSSGAGSPALTVGVGANSVGSVVIAGVGSWLAATGAIDIGAEGSGTLAIQAGATLSASSLQVGGGGSGTLTEENGAILTTGSAGLTIGAGGVATLQGAFASGEIVGFTGAGGLLDIANPAAFHGVVDGFQSGDTVEIAGLTSANATITVSGGNTILTLSSGGTITFAGLYGQNGAGLATLLGIGGSPQSETLASINLDDVAPMTAAPMFAADDEAAAPSPAQPTTSPFSATAMGHDPPFAAELAAAWTSAFADDMSRAVAAIGLTESAAVLAQTMAAALAAQRHW
jgi:T5SS/PEP-CTERM-associated repeat protein